MKKNLFVFFVLFLAIPLFAQKKTTGNLWIGGSYVSPQFNYNYSESTPYESEYLTAADSFDKISTIGFSGGLGIFVIEDVELTADVSFVSKTSTGMATLHLPNAYYFNDIWQDDFSGDRKFSETFFNFGIKYHFPVAGSFKPLLD